MRSWKRATASATAALTGALASAERAAITRLILPTTFRGCWHGCSRERQMQDKMEIG